MFQNKGGQHALKQSRDEIAENEDIPHWAKNFYGTTYRNFTVMWNEMKTRWHRNAPFPHTTIWKGDSFKEEALTSSESTSIDLRSSKDEKLFQRRRTIAALVITVAVFLVLVACIVSAILIDVVLVTPPKDATVEARLKARISNFNITEELLNKTSAEFQQFQKNFCFEVQRLINEDSYCLVTDIRNGSIIVVFNVFVISWNVDTSYDIHVKNILMGSDTVGEFRLSEVNALYSRVIVKESIPSDADFYSKEQYSSTSTELNDVSQTSISTVQPDLEKGTSSIPSSAYSSYHSLSYGQDISTSSEFQTTYSADQTVSSVVSSQVNYTSSQLAVSSSLDDEQVHSSKTAPTTVTSDSKQSVTEISQMLSSYNGEISTVKSSMQSTGTTTSNFGPETLSSRSEESGGESSDLISTNYNEEISPTPSSPNVPDASSTMDLVTSEHRIVTTGISPSTLVTVSEMESMMSPHFTSKSSSIFLRTTHIQDTSKQTEFSSGASIWDELTSNDMTIRSSTTESEVWGQSSSDESTSLSVSSTLPSSSDVLYSSYVSQGSFQSEDHTMTSSLVETINSRTSEQETVTKSTSKSEQFSTTYFHDIEEPSVSTAMDSDANPEPSVTLLTSIDDSDLQSSNIDSTNKIENTEYSEIEQSDTSPSVSQSQYPDITHSLLTTEYGPTYTLASSSFDNALDGTTSLMTLDSSSSTSSVLENSVDIQSSQVTIESDGEGISFSEHYTETSVIEIVGTSDFSGSESLSTPSLEEDNHFPSVSLLSNSITAKPEVTTDNALTPSSSIDAVSMSMDTSMIFTEHMDDSNSKYSIYSTSVVTVSKEMPVPTSTALFSMDASVSTTELYEDSESKTIFSTSALTLSESMLVHSSIAISSMGTSMPTTEATEESDSIIIYSTSDLTSTTMFIKDTLVSTSELYEESDSKMIYSSSAMTLSRSMFVPTSTDIFSEEAIDIGSSTFEATLTTQMSSSTDIIGTSVGREEISSSLEDSVMSSSIDVTQEVSDRSSTAIIGTSGGREDNSSFLEDNIMSSSIDETQEVSDRSEITYTTSFLFENDISYSSTVMDLVSSSIDINNELLSSDISAAGTSALLSDVSSDFHIIVSSSDSLFTSPVIIPSSTEDFMMSSSSYIFTESPDVGVQNVVIYQNESLGLTCNVTNAENFTLISIAVNGDEVGRITNSNSTVQSPWTLTKTIGEDYQVYYLEVLTANCTTTDFYTCGIYGDWGVVEQRASIEVRARPGTAEITFPDELVENRIIKQDIQCEVDAGVPTANVTWSVTFNNGTTIQDYAFSPSDNLNVSTSCSGIYTSSFRRSFDLAWHNSSICCNVNQFEQKTSTCKELFLVPENFCIVNNGSVFNHPYDDCNLYITCGSVTTYISSCGNTRYCFDLQSGSCSREPDLDPDQDNDPYSCDGKKNYAYIPVRNECTKYIWCVNGQELPYDCAGGTYYKSIDEPCTNNEEESYCAKQNN